MRWSRDIKKNSSSFSFLTHRCIFLSLIAARFFFFLQCQGNLGRKNIAFLVAYNRPFPLLNFLLKWAKITIYCAPKYQQINECKYLGGDRPNKLILSNNKLEQKSQYSIFFLKKRKWLYLHGYLGFNWPYTYSF